MNHLNSFLHRLYPYQAAKLILKRAFPRPRQSSLPPLSPSQKHQPSTTTSTVNNAVATAASATIIPFDASAARQTLVKFFKALDENEQQGLQQQRQQQQQRHDVFEDQKLGEVEKDRNIRHKDEDVISSVDRVMVSLFGFWLQENVSKIPNSGLGVFIRGSKFNNNTTNIDNKPNQQPQAQKSTVIVAKKGSILAMYPGLLYTKYDPIFWSSLSNQYILKCQDGICVDGKSKGLSGYLYGSIFKRDNYFGVPVCADLSWVLKKRTVKEKNGLGSMVELKNPLVVGQIVNNGTRVVGHNVRYQELDFGPGDCPMELQKYLPNMWYASDWHQEATTTATASLSSSSSSSSSSVSENSENGQLTKSQQLDWLRTVVLVATRDIYENEELYSTYIE